MKHILFLLSVAAVSAVLASCSQNANASAKPAEPEEEFETTEELVAEPYEIQLSEQQQTFVNDNNAFTLNFLKTINAEDKSGKSFVFSPLSITYALSMVNAAAEGATERELEETLGFRQGGIQAVNEFCKTLIDSLPLVDKKVQLSIANAIFVNKDYRLLKPYQKDMQKYYDALAESLDFSSEKSLNRINGWCNKKTNGMIPTILSELNPDAVSYLLNAIYFKAEWRDPFEKDFTRDEEFATARGAKMLPLMHQTRDYRYMKNSTFAAVDMPYGNGQWSMTVMLPHEGKSTDDVIDYLAKNGMSFADDFRRQKVNLKLPRFETSSSTDDLIGTMKKLGLNRVFGGSAEIPNMCNTNVFISMMLQKARIKVDERGSEAAAVTVVMMEKMSAPLQREEPVVFHAKRPFVYLIREASTGVILFVGKFTGE
jgi:serpin B